MTRLRAPKALTGRRVASGDVLRSTIDGAVYRVRQVLSQDRQTFHAVTEPLRGEPVHFLGGCKSAVVRLRRAGK